MKVISPLFIVIAIGLIIYNFNFVNWSQPLDGESGVALIGILCAACVVVLLLIFRTSKIIQKRKKN